MVRARETPPAKRTGKPRLGEPTLTASDWAEAALQLIAEKGLSALTVSTPVSYTHLTLPTILRV